MTHSAFSLDRRELLVKGAAAAGIVGAGTLLSACGGDSAGGGSGASGAGTATAERAGTPRRGGTLTVGIGQTFEDINVLTAAGYRWGQLLAFALYDTLVKYDDQGKPIPQIAERWETPNGRTTLVTIRQGVTFHDGRPLRVEDVVWTLNRIHATDRPVSNNFLALPRDIWGKAEKIDSRTLRITTKKPSRMVENWRFWFIMPENADDLDMGRRPMGTGPFKFAEFVKGDRLKLERNDAYWSGKGPYLDTLTFRFMKDQSVQIASFLAGDVDYLHDIAVADLVQVEGKNDSKLIPSGIYFQWWQPQLYSGPLADTRVRQALMYAFDRRRSNEIAFGGKGIDTWNPFEKTPYWDGERLDISYDPERARSMLAAAGQPNLKLNMLILQDPGAWHRESEVLQQGFKGAGIDASIQVEPSSKWFELLYTNRTHEGIAVNAGTLPFPWNLTANYMLKASLLSNPPRYPDPALPDLEEAYNAAFTTVEETAYRATLTRIQQLMLSEAAVYHTMLAQNQNVAPKNLMGVESTQIGDQRFDGAYFA